MAHELDNHIAKINLRDSDRSDYHPDILEDKYSKPIFISLSSKNEKARLKRAGEKILNGL